MHIVTVLAQYSGRLNIRLTNVVNTGRIAGAHSETDDSNACY